MGFGRGGGVSTLTVGRSLSCSLLLRHSDWFSDGSIGVDEGALSLPYTPQAEVKGSWIYAE